MAAEMSEMTYSQFCAHRNFRGKVKNLITNDSSSSPQLFPVPAWSSVYSPSYPRCSTPIPPASTSAPPNRKKKILNSISSYFRIHRNPYPTPLPNENDVRIARSIATLEMRLSALTVKCRKTWFARQNIRVHKRERYVHDWDQLCVIDEDPEYGDAEEDQNDDGEEGESEKRDSGHGCDMKDDGEEGEPEKRDSGHSCDMKKEVRELWACALRELNRLAETEDAYNADDVAGATHGDTLH